MEKRRNILDEIKKSLASYEALMSQPVNKRRTKMETNKHELAKIVVEKVKTDKNIGE